MVRGGRLTVLGTAFAVLLLLPTVASGGATVERSFTPTLHGAGTSANAPSSNAAAIPNWPTFLQNPQRTAGIADPSAPSPSTAPRLRLVWNYTTGGRILSSPAVVNGTVYTGSWDGYEYALSSSTGAVLWRQYLGVATLKGCTPNIGVTSSATYSDGRVYVGGGDSYWYALDAKTGAVDWKVFVGNTSQGYENWGSPLIMGGFAYIGLSGNCDHPLIRGGLMQVNLTNHSVAHIFYTVPAGQVGASIWASPAGDPATKTVFVATGNPAKNGTSPYAEAIIALNATTLAVESSWQVPKAQQIADGDFGSTPTLFENRSGVPLVSVTNKNGITYIFRQSNVSAGPVWENRTSHGGNSVAAAAFGNGLLYIDGPGTTIRGASSAGGVRALNPNTWTFVWQTPLWAQSLGAPAYANDLLIVPTAGHWVFFLNASNGKIVHVITPRAGIDDTPAIYGGEIIFGSSDKEEYAYAVR